MADGTVRHDVFERWMGQDGRAAAIAVAVALLVIGGPPSTASAEDHGPLLQRLTGLLEPLGLDGMVRPVPAAYDDRVRELPQDLRVHMTGTSWHEGCPVGLDDLRLLEVVHHDLDGGRHWGRLIVHRDAVDDLSTAFRDLHDRSFRIERLQVVDVYGGDDDRSMAANNSSAFNCRPIAGTNRWSEHAYGRALDLNPVQNPYVRGGTVLPPAGEAYLDREDVRPGMLVRPGPVEAFDAIGWGWGGDWSSALDYQHVSATGR